MPPLTRYWIKAGFVNFAAALLLAVLIQLSSVMSLPEFIIAMNPVYFHLFLVGWITQIIMGVSFWMFPPLNKDQPRGIESLGWLSFFCINVGLICRIVSEPVVVLDPASEWRWILIASALLQWAGGMLYVIHIWQRVKGKQLPATNVIRVL
ncbi:hypothetical protein JNL27_01265 [bacterium]|nr:hypothetical protein [bacterium]